MIEAIAAYNVIEADKKDFDDVATQVIKLLLELEPEASQEIKSMNLPEITRKLLSDGKIYAFLAKTNNQAVGVLTLHECAALYAGGVFGEISELYVDPAHRSQIVNRSCVSKSQAAGLDEIGSWCAAC